MYGLKDFLIEDKVWFYVQKEFNEMVKSLFGESILQVYKKCKGIYCFIGFVEKFGKYEFFLFSFSRQYKVIRIENTELFGVLEMEKIFGVRFTQVNVFVYGELLLLYGEEEVIKECVKYYEELFKIENMYFVIRVIFENMYNFFKRKRLKIFSCFFVKGYYVYWIVKRGVEECFFICSSIFEKLEKEIDFLINYIVKEIEFEERYF